VIDAIDSYFKNIEVGLNLANPNRKVIGLMDAMDWPPKTLQLESFYLLILGARGITHKGFWSPAVPTFVHTVQWTWVVAGSDLTQGKIGRSRGDRYRTNMTMRDELIIATQGAWWTEKLQWSVQGNTPAGVALKSAELNPVEWLWWTPLVFMNRQDRESGVIYGAATVQITDMESAFVQQ
jgi:hypothetical protein